MGKKREPLPAARSIEKAERLSWSVAQLLGVVATIGLVVGLVLKPTLSLDVFWVVIVPLLPASFLVSPAMWRNVCPLATLNLLLNRRSGRTTVPPAITARLGVVGIVLLGLLVPARRFVFNTDGVTLAWVIIGVAGVALVMGFLVPVKSGFCNGLCPILPVERLYGHHPLVEVQNPRCLPCSTCTVGSCIDLAPGKSVAYVLGKARRSHRWLATWYGAFAASFPGFVTGYYTIENGPFRAAGDVYLHVALWAGVSYAITAFLIGLFNIRAEPAVSALAAVALGIYYWFAVGTAAATFALPDLFAPIARGLLLVLVVAWWGRPRSFVWRWNSNGV